MQLESFTYVKDELADVQAEQKQAAAEQIEMDHERKDSI